MSYRSIVMYEPVVNLNLVALHARLLEDAVLVRVEDSNRFSAARQSSGRLRQAGKWPRVHGEMAETAPASRRPAPPRVDGNS